MSEQTEKINIIELLMGIKEDVSSIKTDMSNFKEAQRTEKEVIMKTIADVRSDNERELKGLECKFKELETRLNTKINGLQMVQNNLVGDVDNLKKADDKKDAEHYRKVLAFLSVGLGGMVLAKLPDFIKFLVKLAGE